MLFLYILDKTQVTKRTVSKWEVFYEATRHLSTKETTVAHKFKRISAPVLSTWLRGFQVLVTQVCPLKIDYSTPPLTKETKTASCPLLGTLPAA